MSKTKTRNFMSMSLSMIGLLMNGAFTIGLCLAGLITDANAQTVADPLKKLKLLDTSSQNNFINNSGLSFQKATLGDQVRVLATILTYEYIPTPQQDGSLRKTINLSHVHLLYKKAVFATQSSFIRHQPGPKEIELWLQVFEVPLRFENPQYSRQKLDELWNYINIQLGLDKALPNVKRITNSDYYYKIQEANRQFFETSQKTPMSQEVFSHLRYRGPKCFEIN